MNSAVPMLFGLIFSINTLSAQSQLNAAEMSLQQNAIVTAVGTHLFADTNSVHLSPDSVDHVDSQWTNEYWDTKRINVYKDVALDYPFLVTFEDSDVAWPVGDKIVVTSRYGQRNGELHRGIDLDLRTGDDVYSMLSGKVRFVGYSTGHGNTVVVRHPNGLETVYAHLSKMLVHKNDVVLKGQLIGKGGKTGNARGSHLHLEVRYLGRTINPEYLFDFDNEVRIRAGHLWVNYDKVNPRSYSSVRKSDIPVIADHISFEERPKPVIVETTTPSIEIAEGKDSESQGGSHTSDTMEDSGVDEDSYVIQYGDTIYSLARKYKVKIEDLCRANGIEDSFRIKVGQRLSLKF